LSYETLNEGDDKILMAGFGKWTGKVSIPEKLADQK
jgi:hypothetical protein